MDKYLPQNDLTYKIQVCWSGSCSPVGRP